MATSTSNLLDESVWTSIQRDLHYMTTKIQCTLIAPFYIARIMRSYVSLPEMTTTTVETGMDEFSRKQAFINWDLWGPFLFFFIYCALTSRSDESFTFLFSMGLFLLIASALTSQLVLQIHGVPVFQMISILGYALVPMTFLAVLVRFLGHLGLIGRSVTGTIDGLILIFSGIVAFVWSVLIAFVLICQIFVSRRNSRVTTISSPIMTSNLSGEGDLERRYWLLLPPLIMFYGFLIWSLVITMISK